MLLSYYVRQTNLASVPQFLPSIGGFRVHGGYLISGLIQDTSCLVVLGKLYVNDSSVKILILLFDTNFLLFLD